MYFNRYTRRQEDEDADRFLFSRPAREGHPQSKLTQRSLGVDAMVFMMQPHCGY